MPAFTYMTDWSIHSRSEQSGEFSVEGSYDKEPTACIECGAIGELYKHGTREQTVRDAPLWGKPVAVKVVRKRYRCRACGVTFVQPLPDLDDKRHMTRRCVEFIKDQSIKRSFHDIATQIGVDPKTVWAIAQEHFQTLQEAHTVDAPEYLGIDETGVLSKPRAIFTDVGKRRVLDLLPNRSQESVTRWLYHLPNKDRVKAVSIDMWQPYKRSVIGVLPKAVIVVDRFHISAMANLGLEVVRKRVGNRAGATGRKRLMRSRFVLLKRDRDLRPEQRFTRDTWLKTFKSLHDAYWIKEGFMDLWLIKDKAKAQAAFKAWQEAIPKPMEPHFKVLLTALGNWRTEIMAYWDFPITAAFTEAKNKTIKNIARSGPNFSFESVRAKLLFGGKKVEDMAQCDVCQGLYSVNGMKPEHVIPLSAGGSKAPANVRMVCVQCHGFHTQTWLRKQ